MFLLVIGTYAQSTNPIDYQPIFQVGATTHLVDTQSIQIVSNGNRVFWSAHWYRNFLVLTSIEVNCVRKSVRMRTIRFLDGNRSYDVNKVTPWLRPDLTSVQYVRFACS